MPGSLGRQIHFSRLVSFELRVLHTGEPEDGRVRQDARVAAGQRLLLRHHRPHCQGDQLGQAEGGAQAEAAGIAQSTDDEGGRKLRLGLVLHFEVLLYM